MPDIKISQLTPKGSQIGPNDLLEVSVFEGLNYATKSIKGENIISASSGTIHVPIKPLTNQLVSLNINGDANAIPSTYSNNTLRLYPFIPSKSFSVNQIEINVATAITGGLAKILIYSDNNGVPASRAFASANIDCSTTGFKTYTISQLLYPATIYWIGFNINNSLISFNSFEAKNLRAFAILSNNSGVTAYRINSINFGSEPGILSGLGVANLANEAAPIFYIRST